MLSNASDINALLTGRSSDALMGATGTGTVSTDSGAAVAAFQGQLDKAMQRHSGMERSRKINTVEEETHVSL